MNKKDVTKTLISLLDKVLVPLGFKKYKASDAWVYHKDTDFGCNEIPLLIWQYGELFYVSLSFNIRIDAINKVFLPYSFFVVHDNDTTATISAGIKEFGYENGDKIVVENEEGLKEAAGVLKDILINNGLQFFDKYQTVSSIDKEMNRKERPVNLFVDQLFHRALIGLTASALSKESDFEHWVSYYREKIKSDEKRYESFVKYLRENIV